MSKRQSPTTVLYKTTLTRTITPQELLILLGSNQLLTVIVVCATGGPGLCDPCEKDTVDALGSVSMQEREDLTASAQVGIRYQEFFLKLLGFLRFRG